MPSVAVPVNLATVGAVTNSLATTPASNVNVRVVVDEAFLKFITITIRSVADALLSVADCVTFMLLVPVVLRLIACAVVEPSVVCATPDEFTRITQVSSQVILADAAMVTSI